VLCKELLSEEVLLLAKLLQLPEPENICQHKAVF
jgi:hypothetical protein